jgi:hypothetical protein
MFRENDNHLQGQMFTTIDNLHESAKKRLQQSWASSFYKDFFQRIQESDFAPLYSNKYSRPNTPVNILVGLEALKSGFGWSDEILYNEFLFNIMIRYALGLHDFDEGYFDLRTLYYFRKALTDYEKSEKINLIAECFKSITDAQLDALALKTGIQRMDSTLIQSNIRNMSRLQLLIEVLQNLWKILSPGDRERTREQYGPFLKEDSLHYCYRVKHGEADSHLAAVGQLMHSLIETLSESYRDCGEYQQLLRVFGDHFRIENQTVAIKKGEDLTGETLQSPYDEEATYRRKGKDAAKGYVANITETCDKDNPLQLITQVSVDTNSTDDQSLLAQDVREVADRMDINELWTDGGYTGDTSHEAVTSQAIEHRVTAVKGRKKEADDLGLEDFEIEIGADGIPTSMKCPGGQSGEIRKGSKPDQYSCGFCVCVCVSCPLQNHCPTKCLKKPIRIIRFSIKEMRIAFQRKQVATQGSEGNIRAAVESTVRSVIHPFGGHLCKLSVRGKFRVSCMIILSALMVNIRRIASFRRNEGWIPGNPGSLCFDWHFLFNFFQAILIRIRKQSSSGLLMPAF